MLKMVLRLMAMLDYHLSSHLYSILSSDLMDVLSKHTIVSVASVILWMETIDISIWIIKYLVERTVKIDNTTIPCGLF